MLVCTVLAALCLLVLSQRVQAQIAPTSTATIAGSVSDRAGRPVANATVSLNGPRNVVTHTDAQGLFAFVGVPLGTYQISATTVGLGMATRSVQVESDTNVAIQYQPESGGELKTIAHVGTSANASFNVTPASITAVSPQEHAFDGQTSWRTLLEEIPGVTTSGGYLSYGTHALPDSPFSAAQVSLDGALPYETAPMLDDMPLIGASALFSGSTAGSGTDLSLYPLNAFAGADIVRGPGAAAPSIVDSIGGSIVLRSPGEVTNNRAEFSVSSDPFGGITANGLIAHHWKHLSVVATYGIFDTPGPISTPQMPVYTTPETVNGESFVCGPPLCNTTFQFPSNYQGNYFQFQSGLVACCIPGNTAATQSSGSIALSYDLSPRVTVGVFYAGQQSRQDLVTANLTNVFAPAAGYSGSLAPGTYYGPLGVSDLGLELESASLLEEKFSATIGSGLLRVAALQNRTFSTEVLNSLTSYTAQLYGAGIVGGTPMFFNGGTYTLTQSPFIVDATTSTANRDIAVSYTTPLGENMHAAVSYVSSYYNNPCSTYQLVGTFPLTFGTSSSNYEMTREMRLLVGGNPTNKTSIDLSMYFVNVGYHVQNPNDVTGNTYVNPQFTYAAPRAGFVWRPTPNVAVRASAGGGFAEAQLYDMIGSNGAPIPSNPPGYYTVTLTNLNLQPEKSFAFDFGTDLQLKHGTMLSFDVYRANLYGQIYNSTSLTGTFNGSPLYTQQYRNLGQSRLEGMVLDLHHDVQRGVYWHLAAGFTRGYVISVPAGFYNTPSCTNCANLYVVPNINFNGWFEASIPYSQANAVVGYRWSPMKFVDLEPSYYGPNNSYYRPAFLELDGHFSYPVTKNISLLATFENITGRYDAPIQVVNPANLLGVPAISGAPFALYGQQYGPRTVILTTNVRL